MPILLTTQGRRSAVLAAVILLVPITSCAAPEAKTERTPPARSSAPATPPSVPDRQAHTLVLSVTGTGAASLTAVKYTVDGRVVQEGPSPLPWRRSLSVPADGRPHSYDLDIQYSGTGNATLDAFAIFDGKVVSQTSGAAGGSGNNEVSGGTGLSGSIMG